MFLLAVAAHELMCSTEKYGEKIKGNLKTLMLIIFYLHLAELLMNAITPLTDFH